MTNTIQWIAIVGGTALLIWIYYLVLERLGDWLEVRVVPRQQDEAHRAQDAMHRAHLDLASRVGRRP